ncbi:disintegrin and metalloproteinase domain-containing protein 32 isoform X2 [Ailuropoda melanoleuca]|uniref:disintegrin and metalloproteinase domain-containing protein 32 isoform X2 n=1 Tax=Ailuropoda melanoleuca TaxID=9646 RepID=UPI0014940A21|nr:disintegrin and metalloproteinase domain-containing protein 32 isoform X2 [Ailuropoda melanoleuca]
MLGLMLLLAGLGGLLASGPGSQNSFLQIVVPEKIQTNISDNSEADNEQISYIIAIDEKPYTVHLKQSFFLAQNFMVYLYNQGSVNSHPSDIQAQCYYHGHIEGHPNSVVTLRTCSGLRGILQFENVSYGIEPLESAVEFQHLLYKLRNGNGEFEDLTENNQGIEQNPVDYKIFVSEKSESAVPDLIPLYLEMHIVVDKALYDYLGSDSMIVANKVIEIIGLVNSMFAQFKVTVVLSSLELWSDKNKISTVGEADEVLRRFLEWKKFYLTLRPHDIAYLFIYRDHPYYVGATIPGKMCVTQYSAGIALMIGLSLGISYDDTKNCHCSGAICVMNPEAVRSSGVKTFSSCSLSDFENFVSNMGAKCLQNKPQMQTGPASICGNGKVERGEVCDCGTEEQCGAVSCCNFRTCTLKPGSQCDVGLCCRNCQIERAGVLCRGQRHRQCDFPEFCDGNSPDCPYDITVKNGHTCNQQYVCYDGGCQDTDARCETTFGKGSKNAPFACYEEIHSQADRFGNCGLKRGEYQFCTWRNLQCGRLICTYPTRIPFYRENGAVIYAFVQNNLCITIDYKSTQSKRDPMIVFSGSRCDKGRICVNRECIESMYLITLADICAKQCGGRGVTQKAALTHLLADPDQRAAAKQIQSDPGQKVVLKHIPADPNHRKAPKHVTVVTNNSFRGQWILQSVSLRNENSTFPPLVTVKGNNKPSVELFACASVFLSSSTPDASVLSFQGLQLKILTSSQAPPSQPGFLSSFSQLSHHPLLLTCLGPQVLGICINCFYSGRAHEW